MSTVSTNIRKFRQERRLRQRDLAEVLGIPVSDVAKYERGFEELPQGLESALVSLGASFEPDPSPQRRLCGEGYVTSKAETGKIVKRSRDLDPQKKAVVDLFCGVGGFSHGFELSDEFEVSCGIDLLGDRLDTFCSNHPSASAYGGDIREVGVDFFEENGASPFVVVGGPPCQGFSSLRPYRNVEWNDPRNNLAEEFVRSVAVMKPEWIVFENVVGLLTHGNGKTFASIEAAFQEIGYRTSVRVINGAHFGLPQKRERLILIGSLRQKAVDWPKPTHRFDQKSMAGRSEYLIRSESGLFGYSLEDAVSFSDATSDLPELASGQKATEYSDATDLTPFQSEMRAGASKLTMHEATRHSDKMLEIIRHSGANIHALPPGMVTSGFSSCYSRLAADEPSTTITVNFVHPASNRCIHPTQDRALTPREGARLQSFEDTFEFVGSRSQIVKQIGNAVPPFIGKLVAETILRSD